MLFARAKRQQNGNILINEIKGRDSSSSNGERCLWLKHTQRSVKYENVSHLATAKQNNFATVCRWRSERLEVVPPLLEDNIVEINCALPACVPWHLGQHENRFGKLAEEPNSHWTEIKLCCLTVFCDNFQRKHHTHTHTPWPRLRTQKFIYECRAHVLCVRNKIENSLNAVSLDGWPSLDRIRMVSKHLTLQSHSLSISTYMYVVCLLSIKSKFPVVRGIDWIARLAMLAYHACSTVATATYMPMPFGNRKPICKFPNAPHCLCKIAMCQFHRNIQPRLSSMTIFGESHSYFLSVWWNRHVSSARNTLSRVRDMPRWQSCVDSIREMHAMQDAQYNTSLDTGRVLVFHLIHSTIQR